MVKSQTGDFAAVLSCSDKTGLDAFASGLHRAGLTVLASTGTRRSLAERGVDTVAIEQYTAQAPGTLAKTLQAKLHEAILVDQSNPVEMRRLRAEGTLPMRVVCCDIYPLVRAMESGEAGSLSAVAKLIDVGGPALLTCAARSFRFVFAVSDRADYDRVLCALGEPLDQTMELRRELAGKALAQLEAYYASARRGFESDFIGSGEGPSRTGDGPADTDAALLELLRRTDPLKRVLRANKISDGSRFENSAEHSWQAALAAYLLADWSNSPVDVSRVVQMLVIHDLVEVEAGDSDHFDPVSRDGARQRELAAAETLLGRSRSPRAAHILDLWNEFEAGASAEAKFARAVDMFLPLYLNVIGGGAAWGGFRTSRLHYQQQKQRILEGSRKLWEYSLRLIDHCVENQWLTD